MGFDLNLMDDYIKGRNIPNLDELESNPKFIYEATLYSKDKNMYNLWSNSMRKNYAYVRVIISLFCADIDFINMVAMNCLKNNKVDDDFFELCILMLSFIPKDSEFYNIYSNLCKNIRSEYKDEFRDFETLKKNKKNKIILDYIAKEEAIDLFIKHGKKKDDFEGQSWLYMYDFIRKENYPLAFYISDDQCNFGNLVIDIMIDIDDRLEMQKEVKSLKKELK